ncbi:hypothetical protein M2128_001338 [Polynucleobacter sphagniphilus]|uniref:hypothetical protein n=1 Tax=Polynucleobacter sphagniphilus TaxID=1743169 RepID=UPI002476072C|nr:hypothetical protein [Polynucleobacter sphagniphilus]MDH6302417.1 hypothetical protein [Polynucleobacter sphagniphilus]
MKKIIDLSNLLVWGVTSWLYQAGFVFIVAALALKFISLTANPPILEAIAGVVNPLAIISCGFYCLYFYAAGVKYAGR